MAKKRQHYQHCQNYQSTIALGTPDAETPLHIALACEAVLDGWTREHVVTTLISRIRSDQAYLAYRKTCRRKTNYDEKVQRGMRALALAACWLADALTALPTVPQTPPAAVASQLPLAQTAARLKQPLRGR